MSYNNQVVIKFLVYEQRASSLKHHSVIREKTSRDNNSKQSVYPCIYIYICAPAPNSKGLLEENKRLRAEVNKAGSALSKLQTPAETRKAAMHQHQNEARRGRHASTGRGVKPCKKSVNTYGRREAHACSRTTASHTYDDDPRNTASTRFWCAWILHCILLRLANQPHFFLVNFRLPKGPRPPSTGQDRGHEISPDGASTQPALAKARKSCHRSPGCFRFFFFVFAFDHEARTRVSSS